MGGFEPPTPPCVRPWGRKYAKRLKHILSICWTFLFCCWWLTARWLKSIVGNIGAYGWSIVQSYVVPDVIHIETKSAAVFRLHARWTQKLFIHQSWSSGHRHKIDCDRGVERLCDWLKLSTFSTTNFDLIHFDIIKMMFDKWKNQSCKSGRAFKVRAQDWQNIKFDIRILRSILAF